MSKLTDGMLAYVKSEIKRIYFNYILFSGSLIFLEIRDNDYQLHGRLWRDDLVESGRDDHDAYKLP